MSALLKIGMGIWLAKDAATAAKVVDLLSAMKPLEPDMDNGAKTILFHSERYSHRTEIIPVHAGVVIAKDADAARKLRPKVEDKP